MLPVPEEFKDDKQKFFHEVGFETSDIDLFLYGLTPEESKAKVRIEFVPSYGLQAILRKY